jgi:hypothetical protein|tara:strand:- start:714 stop:887 length:174 start_codon:yes stop_codon:yes gene_type:complete
MQKNTNKVVIKIIADVETKEFVLDEEELPYILEDILIDLLHEISGVKTKDVTVKVVK